jgi:hypothetical protein
MKRLGVWGERKAKKRLRFDASALAIMDIPSAHRFRPDSTPSKRKLVITSYRKRLLDDAAESLAGGACKHYVDGLRDAGAIWEDSQKWCERVYRQVKDAGNDERLEIEVWG